MSSLTTPAVNVNVTGHKPVSLTSVDQYLGPGATRFFGAGHQRVRYEFRDLAVEPDGRVHGHACVSYPTGWSTKATGPLRPHLSTIDALILGADLAEAALRRADGDAWAGWLRRVDIRAGAAPYEEGLDRVAVGACVISTVSDGEAPVSVVECTVANMVVRCEVVHGLAHRTDLPLYGGYRERRQLIEDVTVDVDRERADATVTILASGEQGAPVITLVDSFVVALQMGQVLLYELDGVERANSNTLWMRNTTITCRTPHPPIDQRIAVTTSLSASRLLKGRGATWRSATVEADVNGVRARCSVAHELPIGRA
jgi:hypothetical protein